MKYYIIYEEYSDYNQFEGNWTQKIQTFNSYEAAKKELNGLRTCYYHTNYRKRIGPLIKATKVKPSYH